MGSKAERVQEAVREAIVEYQELNDSNVQVVGEEPSPLEFMRLVALNRPCLIKKGARNWTAVRKWNSKYLSNVMRDEEVEVAVSPLGNADAPVKTENGDYWFVKPLDKTINFVAAVEHIKMEEASAEQGPHVQYCQSQNDNMRNEYSPLLDDIPRDIPWARIALEKTPDAINFWLGHSKSTTSLHKDNYENVYVQVVGSKTFTILPPVETACVNEQMLPTATYVEDSEGRLVPTLDDDPSPRPFPLWDPDQPEENASPLSKYARPIVVTLEPGDMFYLPSMWWHKVAQKCGEEGICVAVNYWYDMNFNGSLYSLEKMAQGVSWALFQEEGDQRREHGEKQEL
ncbi:Clavaminate synthase-like protein [Eremomyces bilateralis CBS 781.70]|uniref:Clavaminate synthase-like protein n=1 Tax=Eremomyces bilateralis CBS 781.70 TaxID=1392243 RepID=A0A6G1FRC0_9PEZI|nr:Clavaminate synthase-like protein [Eremomyces bilateralis CBS 781.70]KAF1808276.1 Clavaminate synthase-like protein [Eremomyces bilateralis CBS 781.70]